MVKGIESNMDAQVISLVVVVIISAGIGFTLWSNKNTVSAGLVAGGAGSNSAGFEGIPVVQVCGECPPTYSKGNFSGDLVSDDCSGVKTLSCSDIKGCYYFGTISGFRVSCPIDHEEGDNTNGTCSCPAPEDAEIVEDCSVKGEIACTEVDTCTYLVKTDQGDKVFGDGGTVKKKVTVKCGWTPNN
jgi:hypothetical protein